MLINKIGSVLGLSIAFSTPSMAASEQEVDLGKFLEQASQACERHDDLALQQASHELRQHIKRLPNLSIAKQQYVEQWLFLFQYGVCRPEQIKQKNSANTSANTIVQPQPTVATKGAANFSASVGYVDNINAGTRHERLNVNNPFGEGEIELQVGQGNLPIASAVVGARGTYQTLNTHGGLDYVAAMQQLYTEASTQNMTGFAAGRQWQAGVHGNEAHLAFVSDAQGNSRASLSGRYQKALGEASQVPRILDTGIRYDVYPEQAEQNAAVVDVRLQQPRALPQGGQLLLGTSLSYNHALGERPGGDRVELAVSNLWQGEAFMGGWQPQVNATLAYQRDLKPYNQALFGESTRNQVRAEVGLGLSKTVLNNKRLSIKYTIDRTNDSGVALFDLPVGNAVTVAIDGRFGK
ncbi:MAG: hypothetical protein BWK73_21235 [Thiothrix lacustris]|uniref:Autotransporter domain-containing protein n=1 Tax=Thiothrix lacustris TaxID=525917 RepID=A0A1Y1QNW8_9GAMM|nr:MAG: hypothetical protein BWK73_21235 [Thiothrix lacustris]